MALTRRRFGAWICFSALASSCLLLAGCPQSETPATGASPAAETSAAPGGAALKIGLITPGDITDKGWSQLAYDAVQKMKTDLGAEVAPPVEKPGKAEVEGAIQKLAADGNTLIFLHGSEYDDAAKNVAEKFPNSTFVVVGGRNESANLTPIQFAAGDATYLAGMVAASMTKTGKIGCVGGDEIPIIKAAFASFEKGVKAVKPTAEVKIVFTGSGNDAAKAKQQTQALLAEGVDVVIHNANAGGQGVAQAVQEKPGAMFIGANADQSELATSQNLGSFILDTAAAYAAVGKAMKEGKSAGKAYSLGIKEGVVSFKFNDKFAGTIPADVKAKVEQTSKDIADGKVKP